MPKTHSHKQQESIAKVKKPSFYNVILTDNRITPKKFVIDILQNFFDFNYEQAEQLMFTIKQNGCGVCGVYTHEIAETKLKQVIEYISYRGYTLKCSIEKIIKDLP